MYCQYPSIIKEQPHSVNRVPMTDKNGKTFLDKNGKPIITRQYTYTNSKGKKVVIQDHSAGHSKFKGDAAQPHFNVRPAASTRHGSVPGTKKHYTLKKQKLCG